MDKHTRLITSCRLVDHLYDRSLEKPLGEKGQRLPTRNKKQFHLIFHIGRCEINQVGGHGLDKIEG